MTVKQKTALNRILEREKLIRPDTFGLRASLDKWVITDGAMAVMFHEKPDGFHAGSKMDSLAEYILDEFENGNFILASTQIDIPTWKADTKGYQQKKLRSKQQPAHPMLHIEAIGEDGRVYEGHYNKQYVLDAVEALGSKAFLYISTRSRKPGQSPSLMVLHEDWMEDRTLPFALILPYLCRNY